MNFAHDLSYVLKYLRLRIGNGLRCIDPGRLSANSDSVLCSDDEIVILFWLFEFGIIF